MTSKGEVKKKQIPRFARNGNRGVGDHGFTSNINFFTRSCPELPAPSFPGMLLLRTHEKGFRH